MDMAKCDVEPNRFRSQLELLPVELILDICINLPMDDVFYLWLGGSHLLNNKISQLTQLPFKFSYYTKPYVTWPQWISNFKNLEALSFGHCHLYAWNLEGCDLSTISNNIRKLDMEFDSTLDWTNELEISLPRFTQLKQLRVKLPKDLLTISLMKSLPSSLKEFRVSGNEEATAEMSVPNFIQLLPRELEMLDCSVQFEISERYHDGDIQWPPQLKHLTVNFVYIRFASKFHILFPPNLVTFFNHGWKPGQLPSIDLPRSITGVSTSLKDLDNLPPTLECLSIDRDDSDTLADHLAEIRDKTMSSIFAVPDWIEVEQYPNEVKYVRSRVQIRTLGDMLPATLKSLQTFADVFHLQDIGSLPTNLETLDCYRFELYKTPAMDLPNSLTSLSVSKIDKAAVPFLPKTLTSVSRVVSSLDTDLSRFPKLADLTIWAPPLQQFNTASIAALAMSIDSLKTIPSQLNSLNVPHFFFPTADSLGFLPAKLTRFELRICGEGFLMMEADHWRNLPPTLVSFHIRMDRKASTNHTKLVPAIVDGLSQHLNLEALHYCTTWCDMIRTTDAWYLQNVAPNVTYLALPVPENLTNDDIRKLPRKLLTLSFGGTKICNVDGRSLSSCLPPALHNIILPKQRHGYEYKPTKCVSYSDWNWDPWAQ